MDLPVRLAGGRALFDLCAKRDEPIPFFGELGSINPVFVLDSALQDRGPTIAEAWANSLTMGVGQFCTNPGVLVLSQGVGADAFIHVAQSALENVVPQVMLTGGIAAAYRAGCERVSSTEWVNRLVNAKGSDRTVVPALFATTASQWLSTPQLGQEIFGPAGIVVLVQNAEERLSLAQSLDGQLTCSVHMDADDRDAARQLLSVLERKAGRILANGFLTGVEVSDAMVHGGPCPASTNFRATSVGTLSIRRFLRPVCYQNIPTQLLPDELR